MNALLYFIFILSGAAGLIYESVWSRYLGLFVGHSAYAQIIVLVIFLGGMALGALAVGRRSERMREPLLWYAGVEIAVGLIGLAFHGVFTSVTQLAYDSIFPSIGSPVLLLVVKWTVAALLILPQSVLLGATFPMMSAGILRLLGRSPGRVLSLLYFSNSLGAALGVLVAGFYLIAAAGLPGTLLAAAIINLAVGVTVIAANRLGAWDGARTDEQLVLEAPAQSRSGAVVARDPLLRLLLAVSFGTAAASFIYEIAWIRMLSLVLGSATHSFELMLSAFILGLALGAFWVRGRADSFADPVRTLGVVQWAMGTLAIATLPVYLMSFEWTVAIYSTFGQTDAGYRGFAVARYLICLAVMLPATFCAGITLPLITRTLLASGTGERAIGLVYGFNTFGSILGAGLAGLVLLPLIGVKALLVTGAVIDMALGVLLLARSRGPWLASSRLAPAMALASVLLVGGVISGARLDRVLLSGGVYRTRALPAAGVDSVIYYRDGRTATVSALRTTATKGTYIATNGKPDASVSGDWLYPERRGTRPRMAAGDETTQILLGLIPIAYHPRARTAAVIGQGSGMTSHMMLASPALEELVTIDIEPAMIEGSRVFYPSNRRVFDDPRSKFVIDDAKSYFAAGGRRFDIILSEPSNPWVSGVSGLFTTEFYTRVSGYLSEGGVFGQWLHLYEITDQLVLNVMAALHRNFASYEIYLVSDYDMLIVASNEAALRRPDWSVLDFPELRKDLAFLETIDAEAMEGAYLADRAVFAPLLEHVVPNSDFYPILDLGTERTRYLKARADGFARFNAERFDAASAMSGRRAGLGSAMLGSVEGVPRLNANVFAARMRAAVTGARMDSLPPSPAFDLMRFRQRAFETMLASKRSPTDWQGFVRLTLEVERDFHGGAAGVVYEPFYEPVFTYMNAAGAPADAVAAISYARALAAWDWPRVLTAGDTVARALVQGAEWIPVDMLRDGLAVAHLRTGDPVGARRSAGALARYSRRSPSNLRSMLVASWIESANAADPAATPAVTDGALLSAARPEEAVGVRK